jgi:hypothetical protein
MARSDGFEPPTLRFAHACDGICTGVKCGLYELENTQSLAGDFNLT